MQPKKAAPKRKPRTSILRPCRSDDSGTLTAARTKATTPKPRLNQKMARQLENPTSAPPMTGPSARASPETAAQTPSASALVSRSGYTCRMIDKVPGSLAAAPTPMTTRPAMSQSTLPAKAAMTEPAQKMATPASMIRFRPRMSPSIPAASMKLAKVRAYPLTTHCRDVTPACRSLWMLARPTLTIVLSRKVRKRTAHSVARASACAAEPRPPFFMSKPGGAPSIPRPTGTPLVPSVSSGGPLQLGRACSPWLRTDHVHEFCLPKGRVLEPQRGAAECWDGDARARAVHPSDVLDGLGIARFKAWRTGNGLRCSGSGSP